MAVTFLTNEDKTILDGQINQIDNKLPVVSDAKQTNYVLENTDIDATLSIEGKAADAAAVGEKFGKLSKEIGALYVTPQMFGAVGDGVADDTDAVQAALDNGGVIYFPAGRYKTTRLLTVSKSCRIEMFKQYPNTYGAEYPLTPEDNWMGARIDTYSPDGGMIIGDAVEVDGLYMRAMEGFAGVVLKFDNTVGKYTYPASARLKHIKLEIDSPNTIPVSMFDFTPDGSYHYILDDICLGRNGDAGYCEYGFRADVRQTPRVWANSVTIRNMCIDLHADYPFYMAGGGSYGLQNWLIEALTIQAYRYTAGGANTTNRPGHINLMTLLNVFEPTFIGCWLWDVYSDMVVGEVIKAEGVRGAAVIGCSKHFDAIESYITTMIRRPENLNIANLDVTIRDNADATAHTLMLSDGANDKMVEIPKVQINDEQIGNAVGAWMDANAEPREEPGKNKFNYADKDCIVAGFYVSGLQLVITPPESITESSHWVTPYIKAQAGDVIRYSIASASTANPLYVGCYNSNLEIVEIMSGFVYDNLNNGIRITNTDTKFVRLQFQPTTNFGSYVNRATAQICVTVNNADVTYEDYYTELVGGIGSFMALTSPNGTKYTLSVDDNGVLTAVPAN